jgi:hypothetical protein
MNLLAFLLVVVAGVLGAVSLFQTAFRSLVGWALVALSVGIIIDLCTTLSHTVHA